MFSACAGLLFEIPYFYTLWLPFIYIHIPFPLSYINPTGGGGTELPQEVVHLVTFQCGCV